MEEFGIDLQALATDFGLDLGTIDATLAAGLLDLAELLRVSVPELVDELGIDIGLFGDALADAIANELGTLPPDIASQLDPALAAIRDATDTASLESGIDLLRAITDTLPEEYRNLLAPYLDALEGTTGATAEGVGKLVDLAAVWEKLQDINFNVHNDFLAANLGITEIWLATEDVVIRAGWINTNVKAGNSYLALIDAKAKTITDQLKAIYDRLGNILRAILFYKVEV